MNNRLTRRYPFYHRIFQLALLCSIILEVGCGTSISPALPSPTASLPTVTYQVSGAKILDNHGHVFLPYGVHLMGLYTSNWRHDLAIAHLNRDQMAAARKIWHSNTVSIQLASANLFATTPYDSEYLTRIDQEVTWAHQEGMNILLVLQYEATTQQPLPTQDSIRFWDFMSSHYRDDPWVFFDVFNEPVRPPGLSEAETWPLWQQGGDGYVGMQELVNTIRKNGAENLIFVDGLAAGEDLNGVPAHRIRGDNIVYAIHPYFGVQHQTKNQWDSWFGKVALRANFPIVADEWSEYQSTNAECIPQAPALVPRFLSYLKARHIGLIAWALFPGLLIRGWNYADPTDFDQPGYPCNASFPNYDPSAQGAGQLTLQYFVDNAS